jgi:hypothetical protein
MKNKRGKKMGLAESRKNEENERNESPSQRYAKQEKGNTKQKNRGKKNDDALDQSSIKKKGQTKLLVCVFLHTQFWVGPNNWRASMIHRMSPGKKTAKRCESNKRQ